MDGLCDNESYPLRIKKGPGLQSRPFQFSQAVTAPNQMLAEQLVYSSSDRPGSSEIQCFDRSGRTVAALTTQRAGGLDNALIAVAPETPLQ